MLVGASPSRQCPTQLTGRQLHQPLVCSAAQAAMAHSDSPPHLRPGPPALTRASRALSDVSESGFGTKDRSEDG